MEDSIYQIAEEISKLCQGVYREMWEYENGCLTECL